MAGVFEIIGGIGLKFDELSAAAASGLPVLVLMAMSNHYKVKHHIRSFIPPLVLGSALTIFSSYGLI